ncbi:hypothetical protein PRZ48_004152 [Zasmidium cellare]|uniref:Uncharacterized protein n=1 Tax=Zasmidium cellare TaxID=395010 RepID=A0ABR0EX47_ZASCE|nr:hypothetical protein PRZ48_004152 [Zasmidium cellare]
MERDILASRIYETLQPGAKEAKRRKRAKHIRRARQQAVRHIEGLLSPCVQPAFLKDQAWVDLALHQCEKGHTYLLGQSSSALTDATGLGVKRPRTWMDFDLERRLGTSVDKITNWIRYIAMTDPALFCVEACAAVFFSLPKDSESLKNYLWLENHAVQQINLALNDPGRRFSSLTIVAILFCASYYAFCGDIRIARDVHVPGLKRILAIKGEERFVEELPAPVVAMSPWYAQQVTKTCGVAEPIFSWSGPDGGDVLAMIRSAVSEDLA